MIITEKRIAQEVKQMNIGSISGTGGGYENILALLLRLQSENSTSDSSSSEGPQSEGDPQPHLYGNDSVDLSDEASNYAEGPQKPGDPDPIGHPNGPDSQNGAGPQKPGDPDPIGHPNGPGPGDPR
jgi:hypothetical protein